MDFRARLTSPILQNRKLRVSKENDLVTYGYLVLDELEMESTLWGASS